MKKLKKQKRILMGLLIIVTITSLMVGCNKGKYGDDTKIKSQEIATSLVQEIMIQNYQNALNNYPYTSGAKKEINEQKLIEIWNQASEAKGSFKEIDGFNNDNWDKALSITVHCIFEKGTTNIKVDFDRTVKIKNIAIN